ncbi:unnamed protein product [Prunus armeniaca]
MLMLSHGLPLRSTIESDAMYQWKSLLRKALPSLRGTTFCEKFMKEVAVREPDPWPSKLFGKHLCSQFNINIFFASPAHPQSNGQVEAINKIIKKTLKKKLGAAKGDWPEILPEALWANNTSYRRSTSETPFSLAFGTEAVVPIELHGPTC